MRDKIASSIVTVSQFGKRYCVVIKYNCTKLVINISAHRTQLNAVTNFIKPIDEINQVIWLRDIEAEI